MRNATGLVLLVLSGSLACTVPVVRSFASGQSVENSAQEQQAYLDKDAYDVYAARLPSEWPWSAAKAERLVIQQETTTYPAISRGEACLPGGADFPERWKEALADYQKQNEITRVLARGFVIDKPYDLIPRKEFQEFFSKDGSGWKSFYERYPYSGGMIQLSAVGFSRDRNSALVYIAHNCGWLCGGGGYSFLEKKDGKWVVAIVGGNSCGWVS